MDNILHLQTIVDNIFSTNYIDNAELQKDLDKHIDTLIVGLEQLNKQIKNTTTTTTTTIIRDKVIELLLTDKEIQNCINKHILKFLDFYNKSQGMLDVESIVFEVVRDLLQKLDFKGRDIDTPKGYLISNLFSPKAFSGGKSVMSYVDSYFNRRTDKIKIKEELTYDCIKKVILSDISDINDDEVLESDIQNIQADHTLYIDDYSVSLDDYKFKYFYDLDKAHKEYKKVRQRKYRKWEIYRDNDDNFIRHIAGQFKSENIDIEHKVKDLKFDDVLGDVRTDRYVRQLIIDNLSEMEVKLIELTYYKLVDNNSIVEQMGLKDINQLNRYRSKALGKLKKAIINNYDYILQTYDETYLAYWVRKIHNKYLNKMDKKDNIMFTI